MSLEKILLGSGIAAYVSGIVLTGIGLYSGFVNGDYQNAFYELTFGIGSSVVGDGICNYITDHLGILDE